MGGLHTPLSYVRPNKTPGTIGYGSSCLAEGCYKGAQVMPSLGNGAVIKKLPGQRVRYYGQTTRCIQRSCMYVTRSGIGKKYGRGSCSRQLMNALFMMSGYRCADAISAAEKFQGTCSINGTLYK